MSNQKSVRQTKFLLLLLLLIPTPAEKGNQLIPYIKQLLLNCIQNNNYNNIPTVSVRDSFCGGRFLSDKFIDGTTSEAYRVAIDVFSGTEMSHECVSSLWRSIKAAYECVLMSTIPYAWIIYRTLLSESSIMSVSARGVPSVKKLASSIPSVLLEKSNLEMWRQAANTAVTELYQSRRESTYNLRVFSA